MSISKFFKEAISYRLAGGHSADHNAMTGGGVLFSPQRKVILIGDSFFAFAGTVTSQGNKGFISWANFYSGNKYQYLYNAGIGGSNLADVASRFASDFANASSANEIWINCGINSINGFTAGGAVVPIHTLSQMKQYATSILSQAAATGCRVRWFNIAPVASGYNASISWSSTDTDGYNHIYKVIAFNSWLWDQQVVFKNLIVQDVFSLVVNPTDANAYAQSKYLSATDLLHPNPLMSQLVGYTVWQSEVAFLAPGKALMSSIGETISSPTQAGITENYGLFTVNNGTGGTVGSGWSGTVPVGYSGLATGTATASGSILTEPNGYGKMQQIIASGGVSGGTVVLQRYNSSPSALYTGGDLLSVTAAISIANGATGLLNVKLQQQLSSGAGNAFSYHFNDTLADDVALTASATMPFTGTLTAFPTAAPTGTPTAMAHYITLQLAANASVTATVSRVSQRKMNT